MISYLAKMDLVAKIIYVLICILIAVYFMTFVWVLKYYCVLIFKFLAKGVVFERQPGFDIFY